VVLKIIPNAKDPVEVHATHRWTSRCLIEKVVGIVQNVVVLG
jgi:hypothetical protein